MKLYLSPGACSLAAHIVLHEGGFNFDTEKVNLADKKTASGADYKTVNPKGYVPALQLDNGEVLTEAGVVLQYLADQMPEKKLAPPAGSMERYRLMEWLNFISSELHKTFGPMFNPNAPEASKQAALGLLPLRFDIVEKQLQGRDYLTGNQFTVADAYLFTILSWAGRLNIDLGRWPGIQAYLKRVAARPTVHAALVAEGLVKQ